MQLGTQGGGMFLHVSSVHANLGWVLLCCVFGNESMWRAKGTGGANSQRLAYLPCWRLALPSSPKVMMRNQRTTNQGLRSDGELWPDRDQPGANMSQNKWEQTETAGMYEQMPNTDSRTNLVVWHFQLRGKGVAQEHKNVTSFAWWWRPTMKQRMQYWRVMVLRF